MGAGQILQMIDPLRDAIPQHQVDGGRVAPADNRQWVASGLPRAAGKVCQQTQLFAVRLDKRETGQVDTYAVQLCTRELFDSGGYIQQLVIVHIALPDVAQVRHQNYFVSASLVVCGIRHRPDDLPLRVEGSVSIPGGVLRFAAHRRADEPFFRGKIVQTFQIGYPGISQHGQPAVQIGFRRNTPWLRR